MSRGFVKEDDLELAGTDLPERPISELPNYVTPNGLKQLKEIENITAGSLSGVDGDILVKTFGEKIKGTFVAVKNDFVGGVKDGIFDGRGGVIDRNRSIVDGSDRNRELPDIGQGAIAHRVIHGIVAGEVSARCVRITAIGGNHYAATLGRREGARNHRQRIAIHIGITL